MNVSFPEVIFIKPLTDNGQESPDKINGANGNCRFIQPKKKYNKEDITAATALNALSSIQPPGYSPVSSPSNLKECRQCNTPVNPGSAQRSSLNLQPLNIPGQCYIDLLWTIYGNLKYLFKRECLAFFPKNFPYYRQIDYSIQDFPFLTSAVNSSQGLIFVHEVVPGYENNLRFIVNYLTDLINYFPKDPLLFALRGYFYRLLRLEALALLDLHAALNKDRNNIFALCALGNLYYQKARDNNFIGQIGNLSIGLSFLDQALELGPNSLFALVGRSKIHYALGNLLASSLDIEKALKIDPDDPLVNATYKFVNDINDQSS